MKKKAAAILVLTVSCVYSGMTAFAAPEIMADGTVFDAEYYAQSNPDVATVYGTDKEALLNHYMTYGKAEGRPACGSDSSVQPNITISEIDNDPMANVGGMSFGIDEDILSQQIAESEGTIESDGYEIASITPVKLYANIKNVNLRQGPGVQYAVIGNLAYAEEITATAKVQQGNKIWFVVQSSDGQIKMVNHNLVSAANPLEEDDGTGVGGGALSGVPQLGGGSGSGGGTGLNWE